MLLAEVATLLLSLRALMDDYADGPLAAYIVPTSDAHHSESVSACDRRRAFITGFDGSAGTAVVTSKYALLWTDSRYFIQAEQQLQGTEWILMRSGNSGVPSLTEWLSKNLTRGEAVGVDPALYSKTEWDSLEKELKSNGITLSKVEDNLVDMIWDDRPSCSNNSVFELDTKFAGKDVSIKITEVRKEMQDSNVGILVVSELEEVAWLLNLRGSDFPRTPVFFAFLILTLKGFELFIEPTKVNDAITSRLEGLGGQVFPYEDVADRLEELVNSDPSSKVWVSKNCNYKLVSRVSNVDENRLVVKLTPIARLKAIKNEVEVQGLISAHIRDGAAVVEYFAWLEDQMNRTNDLTELSAAKKLEEFRSTKENYFSLSFSTISASGPNAALPHYSPEEGVSDRKLSTSEIYLVDSGGQYYDGTTDITRTIYFGEPKAEIVECFTRVLKGSIALRMAVFPKKSVGSVLDTLARKPLWESFRDYGHGTGHGIGHFLGVHEGPFSIGVRTGSDDPGLEKNMFTSDEPGYYKEDDFGIRTENIIRTVDATPDGNYLKFEDVTLAPIQLKLIDTKLLTEAEINYLNQYHTKVRDTIGNFLSNNNGSEQALSWLERETRLLPNS